MNRNILFSTLLAFLFTGKVLYGGIEPISSSLRGATLINGAGLTVQDSKWPTVNMLNTYTVFSAYTKLQWGIDERNLTLTGAHTTAVDLTVLWWDVLGNMNTVNNITLTVNYDPARSSNIFTYQNTYVIKGAYKLAAVINKIYNPASPSTPLANTAIPANLYLEAQQQSERYYELNPAYIAQNSSSGVFKIDHNTAPVSTSNELEIYWSQIPGAEAYDLEWSFVNDYSTSLGTYAVSTMDFAFRNSATRIRTSELKYRLSLNYEHGYILYRVRAVGKKIVSGTTVEVTGKWSAPDPTGPVAMTRPLNTFIGSSPFGSFIKFYYYNSSPLEENKNSQYSAIYAEEGKKKEVMSYFDGSLRNRQSVTRNNSLKQAIVGETFYDHQGRPSISTLPVPAYNSGGVPEQTMKYYEDFNLSDTKLYPNSQPAQFSRQDFDLDVSGGSTCPPPSNGMKTTSGSSMYYSSGNPDKEGAQAYVPVADGYPFSHTVYMPDNTGRIRKQSGIGKNFEIGSGHETTNLYSTPLQQDLDQLFGSEAGTRDRYQKNTVVDPNGQITISYLNRDGKVIATAMAGNSPQNLNGLSAPAVTIKPIKFFSADDQNYTNVNLFDGNALVFSWPLVPNVTGMHTFTYNLQTPNFTDNCLYTGFCYDCEYDLQLTIKDECGSVLYTNQVIAATISGAHNYACPGTSIAFSSNGVTPTFQAYLTSGKQYYIEKKLTISASSLTDYLAHYMNTANNPCLKTQSYFTSQEMGKIDFNDCNIGCTDCAQKVNAFYANHNDATKAPGGANYDPNYVYIGPADKQALLDKCNEACKPVSKCDAEFGLMLGDVSPGGQYGQYQAGTYNTAIYPLSIYNVNNLLPLGINNVSSPPVLINLGAQTLLTSIFPAFQQQFINCNGSLALNETAGFNYPKFYHVGNRSFSAVNSAGIYHYYDDQTGTILSKIPLTLVSPGVYEPTPVNAGAIKTDADGSKYIYPEELLNLKDFINNFKPTWARSLVKNHPEWCYFTWCQEELIPSNAPPLATSVDFDNMLRGLDTWASATLPIYSSATGFMGSANPTNVQDLLNNDPYFIGIGQGMAAVGGYPAGYLKTLMLNKLTNAIVDPTNSSNVKNAKEAATMLARYGTAYYVTPVSSNFGSPAFPFSPITVAQQTEILNNEWRAYRSFYLAAKAEVQAIGAHINAINKSTPFSQHCGCYNGCIGEPNFDAYNLPGADYTGFATLMPYMVNSSGSTLFGIAIDGGYLQNGQPCNINKAKQYAAKQKRFIYSRDLTSSMQTAGTTPLSIGNSMLQSAEYGIFQQTGQCPTATKVQNFLNGLVKVNMYNGSSISTQLFFLPSFTKELYDYVDGNTGTFSQYYLVNTSSSSNSYLMEFRVGNISGSSVCNLNLSGSIGGLWSTIKGFSGIRFTGLNTFEVYAFYDHDAIPSTPDLQVLLTGFCDKIQSTCSFSNYACRPNQTGKDLVRLFNHIFNNVATNSNTNYGNSSINIADGNASEYNLMTNNLLTAFGSALSPGYVYVPGFSYSANQLNITFSNSGGNTFNFLFTNPSGNLTVPMKNITYFTNLRTDPNNSCVFYLTGNIVSTSSWGSSPAITIANTQTCDIRVDMTVSQGSCFELTDCGEPIPSSCNTQGYRTLRDLGKFLSELKTKNPASISAPLNISGYNYFTDNLKGPMQGANTALVNYYTAAPSAGGTLFKIQLGNSPSLNTTTDCPILLTVPLTGFQWSSITSFGRITADNTQPGAFSIVINYGNSSIVATGSCCYMIQNCDDCTQKLSTVLVEDFDRFDATTIPNSTPGSDFSVSNYVPGTTAKVTEQEYSICSNTGGTSFGGYVNGQPDCYHETVTNILYSGNCPNNFGSVQHTPPSGSTASFPNNQPGYQDALEVFIDYTPVGLSTPLLPAVVYEKNITVPVGKGYRVGLWFFSSLGDFPCRMHLVVNTVTLNSVYMTAPLTNVWTKLSGILYTNTSTNLNVKVVVEKLNNMSVTKLFGTLLLDDITVEQFDCSKTSAPPVVYTTVNECVDQLTDIAVQNAKVNYSYYIDSVSTSFKNRYLSKCKTTIESLYGTVPDKTHHYTLYYYDQAGNLIKTVPPEGVNPVNIDPTQAQGIQNQANINNDRNSANQTFLTDHKLATRYEYNSLNQLVNQSSPDSDPIGTGGFSATFMPFGSGFPTGVYVNDISFSPNGLNGFVVGSSGATGPGAIYETSDGGQSWSPSGIGGSGDVTKIQHMGSINTIFAVTSKGTILKSTNNGTSWSSYVVANGTRLNALAFFPSTTTSGACYGLVVGDNSTVYFCYFPNNSTPPQFTRLTVPNNLVFDAKTVELISDVTASPVVQQFLIGGTNGVLLHTYNAATVSANALYWQSPPTLYPLPSPINTDVTINDLEAKLITGSNPVYYGYAVGKNSTNSTGFGAYFNVDLSNSGNNTIAPVLFPAAAPELRSLARQSNATATLLDDPLYIAGTSGAIYNVSYAASPSPALYATPSSVPAAYDYNHIEFADKSNPASQDVYAFSGIGLIIKATSFGGGFSSVVMANAGLNGATIPQPYNANNNIFMAGAEGNILKATPASGLFPTVNTTQLNYSGFTSVSYAKDNSGVAFVGGANGTLLKSTGPGAGWTDISQFSGTNITSLDARTKDSLTIVSGTGYRYDYLNGTIASSALLSSGNSLNRVLYKSPGNGFIVGNNGMMTKTTNSWNNYPAATNVAGSTASFKDIYFFGNTGFIVGSGGTVLRTLDNGATWSAAPGFPGPYASYTFWRVYMRDNNTVYIMGDPGIVLGSTDAGNTWAPLYTGSMVSFRAAVYNAKVAQILAVGSTTNSANAYQINDKPADFSSRFFYDKLGRLILSQNAKQYNKSPKAYTYTIYDALSRVTQGGEIAQNIDPQTLTNYNGVIDQSAFTTWLSGGSKTEVSSTFYDNSTISPSLFTQKNLRKRVAASYIDTDDDLTNGYTYGTFYSYDVHGNASSLLQLDWALNQSNAAYGTYYIDYSYDLVSGNVNEIVYQKGKPDEFRHRYEYDANGRITNVHTSNDGGISWQQDAKYYYYKHGLLARTELGPNKVQALDYAYTIQGWTKGMNSGIMSGNTDPGKDAITGSNYISTLNNLHQMVGRDIGAYSLYYYTNGTTYDYKAIDAGKYSYGSATSFDPDPSLLAFMGTAANNALYDGNISAMQTSIAKVNAAPNSGLYTAQPMISSYKYDQLNRNAQARSFADFTGGTTVSNNKFVSITTNANAYRNEFTYDANGNILSQQRYTDAGVLADNLTYRYDNAAGIKKSNKLYHVNDAGTNTAGDINDQGTFNSTSSTINTLNNYSYDPIGNLVKDKAEEIASVEWTLYGRIKLIQRVSTSPKPDLEFKYDALGNRVQKIVKPKVSIGGGNYALSGSNVTTYYSKDAQGNTMAAYENAGGNYKLMEQNVYGTSRLAVNGVNQSYNSLPQGFSASMPNGSTFTGIGKAGARDYELTNHLGNVLTTISDRKLPVDNNSDGTIDLFVADVQSTSDYYPFGAPMPGRQLNTGSFRYGFQDQETDQELWNGAVSYKYRMEDPRLGRFFSMDPLSKEFPWNSPYAFSENSLIAFKEFEGLEKVYFQNDKTPTDISKMTSAQVEQLVTSKGFSWDSDWYDKTVKNASQVNKEVWTVSKSRNTFGQSQGTHLKKYLSTNSYKDGEGKEYFNDWERSFGEWLRAKDASIDNDWKEGVKVGLQGAGIALGAAGIGIEGLVASFSNAWSVLGILFNADDMTKVGSDASLINNILNSAAGDQVAKGYEFTKLTFSIVDVSKGSVDVVMDLSNGNRMKFVYDAYNKCIAEISLITQQAMDASDKKSDTGKGKAEKIKN